MAQKQIHASVEIADHEIRLVVGEFHENHLNILRVERVKVIINENGKIEKGRIDFSTKTSQVKTCWNSRIENAF